MLSGHSAEMRRCLEQGDVVQLRKLWHHVAPHLPQPKNETQMLIAMHMARTQSNSISFKARAYSHAWLCERSIRSGLPIHLRPKAQQIYPVINDAVGIAVGSSNSSREFSHILKTAEGLMSDVVMDHYSSGKPRIPAKIKRDMLRVKDAFFARLYRVSLGWRK